MEYIAEEGDTIDFIVFKVLRQKDPALRYIDMRGAVTRAYADNGAVIASQGTHLRAGTRILIADSDEVAAAPVSVWE